MLRHCREIQSKIGHGINMIDKRSQQEDRILKKIDEAQKWIEQKQNFLSDECGGMPGNLLDNIRQLQVNNMADFILLYLALNFGTSGSFILPGLLLKIN